MTTFQVATAKTEHAVRLLCHRSELGAITGPELRAGLDGEITDEQMTAALGDLQRRHRVTYKHALGTGIGALHDIRSTRS